MPGIATKRRQSATIIRMDVLVLVQVRELFVRRVREWQPALTAARVACIEANLISLTAVTATN